MLIEKKYLRVIFGKIIRESIKNIIKKQNSTCSNSILDEYFLDKGADKKFLELSDLRNIVQDFFGVDIENCPINSIVWSIFYDTDVISLGNQIDFSDEINCLSCIYNIFRLFEIESSWYNIRDSNLAFDKNIVQSALIIRKKNMILQILLKCIENLSIDQELKDQAKSKIENTAKYNKANFFKEEKEDMERIWKSLKFRLDNIQELEKGNLLDELISDSNRLPTDDLTVWPFEHLREHLNLSKSEIGNIVRSLLHKISDYSKQHQVDLTSQKEKDSEESFQPPQTSSSLRPNTAKIKPKNNRQSKVKKENKRKSKSMKINHLA